MRLAQIEIAEPGSGLQAPLVLKGLGEVVCFFGKNGAGKSRLLQAVRAHITADCSQPFPTVSWTENRRGLAEVRAPHKMSRDELKRDGDAIEGKDSFGPYYVDWHVYLEYLNRHLFEALHPAVREAQPQLEEQFARKWTRAQEIIRDIVGMELTREVRVVERWPTPTLLLDGRPIAATTYSPGQQELFAEAIRFLNCYDFLHGRHVFVDEPELHLHPGALRAMLARLRSAVGPDGQIWLGTHSLTLLAELDLAEIWVVREGAVLSPRQEQISHALHELVGEDEGVERLRQVLAMPHAWAATKFAAECLAPPGVVGAKKGDPQAEQFKVAIKELFLQCGRQRVRLLDFGAGRGRLASLLAEDSSTTRQQVCYFALEPDESLHPEIASALDALAKVEPDAVGTTTITTRIPDAGQAPDYYDCILLCNVLHEIAPQEWAELLRTCGARLSNHGVVVILEDQKIPSGELIPGAGFLVLGPEDFTSLFNESSRVGLQWSSNLKYRQRLLAVTVPKETLLGVTVQTVCKALERLQNRSLDALRNLRTAALAKTPDAAAGRDHARFTQLAINARLAIELLKGGGERLTWG